MNNKKIPKRIIIVPYRNREKHKEMFLERINDYLKNYDDWEVYFSHQCDNRPFNRGAMKNIGFLAMKIKYPDHYKDISFIFHDIDTLPVINDYFPYNTQDNIVAHYYGFNFALGGIVVIKGKDFEKIKGYPNFWGWGFEDNNLYKKSILNNLLVDRSIFIENNDKDKNKYITRLDVNETIRMLTKEEVYRHAENNIDDITDLKNITFKINKQFINVTSFEAKVPHYERTYYFRDNSKHSNRIRGHRGYAGRNWGKYMNNLSNRNKK
tara:strand:- start:1124 stop:1921 length:798 start_codon:yes stop_codon:yes gene_type:complete